MIIKHAIKDKIGKYKGKTVLLKNSWKESFNLFNWQLRLWFGFSKFFPIKEKFNNQRNEREKILGKEQSANIEKRIFLQLIDQNWTSHIQYLEQLRTVIGLRSYGQRDPLIEYKKEAFDLFENLLIKLKSDLITVLINLDIIRESTESIEKKEEPINLKKKMKRNEPCFCGSGKKYKHCHGSL